MEPLQEDLEERLGTYKKLLVEELILTNFGWSSSCSMSLH